jgi:hypothetical protein
MRHRTPSKVNHRNEQSHSLYPHETAVTFVPECWQSATSTLMKNDLNISLRVVRKWLELYGNADKRYTTDIDVVYFPHNIPIFIIFIQRLTMLYPIPSE